LIKKQNVGIEKDLMMKVKIKEGFSKTLFLLKTDVESGTEMMNYSKCEKLHY